MYRVHGLETVIGNGELVPRGGLKGTCATQSTHSIISCDTVSRSETGGTTQSAPPELTSDTVSSSILQRHSQLEIEEERRSQLLRPRATAKT